MVRRFRPSQSDRDIVNSFYDTEWTPCVQRFENEEYDFLQNAVDRDESATAPSWVSSDHPWGHGTSAVQGFEQGPDRQQDQAQVLMRPPESANPHVEPHQPRTDQVKGKEPMDLETRQNVDAPSREQTPLAGPSRLPPEPAKSIHRSSSPLRSFLRRQVGTGAGRHPSPLVPRKSSSHGSRASSESGLFVGGPMASSIRGAASPAPTTPDTSDCSSLPGPFILSQSLREPHPEVTAETQAEDVGGEGIEEAVREAVEEKKSAESGDAMAVDERRESPAADQEQDISMQGPEGTSQVNIIDDAIDQSPVNQQVEVLTVTTEQATHTSSMTYAGTARKAPMKSNIPVVEEEGEDESSESSSEEAVEAVESDRESSDKPVANTHREDTERNENEGDDADSDPEDGENGASKPGEVGTRSSPSASQSVGQDAPRIHVQTGGKGPRKTPVVITIPDEEDEEELDREDDGSDDSDHLDDLGGVKREREESPEDAAESPASKRLRIEG